jgi:hypothetical protein
LWRDTLSPITLKKTFLANNKMNIKIRLNPLGVGSLHFSFKDKRKRKILKSGKVLVIKS